MHINPYCNTGAAVHFACTPAALCFLQKVVCTGTILHVTGWVAYDAGQVMVESILAVQNGSRGRYGRARYFGKDTPGAFTSEKKRQLRCRINVTLL